MPVQESYYKLPTAGKLQSEIRLAFLSDLHSEAFGKRQEELLSPIRRFAPDLVLFGGDTFDERVSPEPALQTLTLAAKEWKTFYTPGNHEIKTGVPEQIKAAAKTTGARLLAGESVLRPVRNETLLLCGVEDPLRNEDIHQKQLKAARNAVRSHKETFSLLITHRPERVEEYREGPFDLVLTGHAHGGQWRFPFLKNGFYAPDQGFFPKYTGGLYQWNPSGTHCTMLCSRGLARHNTRVPRIGNPPELVLITLIP